MTEQIDETLVIESMVEFEGFTLDEAKLTYQRRKRLPASAFCGPNRTYPAHDAAHVRNGLARLGTFGGKLKSAVRKRIFGCLLRRAKRMGVEVSKSTMKKYRKVGESSEDPYVRWYLENFREEKGE